MTNYDARTGFFPGTVSGAPHVYGKTDFPDFEARYPLLGLAIGRRGMGKTTILGRAAIFLLSRGRHLVIIHDPWGQFANWGSKPPPDLTLKEIRENRTLPQVVRYSGNNVIGLCEVMIELASRVRADGKKLWPVLLFDEIDRLFIPGGYLGDPPRERRAHGQMESIREWSPGPVHTLITEGRHVGVDVIGGVRIPTAIHHQARSLADVIWVFQTTEPRYRQWISQLANEDWGKAAGQLRVGEYLQFQPGK